MVVVMNTYQTFYRQKKHEVQAHTSYEAQQIAAQHFKAKKSYDVTVVLVAKGNIPVSHGTEEFS